MATTETIRVPEIHCDHCKTSIEGALRPLEGVSDAHVDVDARQVTVTYDAASIERSQLLEAIIAQGYELEA